MEHPLVSVIIPAFNAEKYIAEAVRSACLQTYSNIEIIVVNDGSTDSTADIIRSMGDSRIHLINQDNQGLSGARNAALAVAKGELVAFLDADDRWHNDKLFLQIPLFQNKSVGLVYSGARYISKTGQVMGESPIPSRSGDVLNELLLNNFITVSSVMLRLSFIKKHNLKFKPRIYRQDYDLWLQLAPLCDFAFVADRLVDYRRHDDAISMGFDSIMADYELVVERQRGRIADMDASEVEKEKMTSRLECGRLVKYLAISLRLFKSMRVVSAASYFLRGSSGLLFRPRLWPVISTAFGAYR